MQHACALDIQKLAARALPEGHLVSDDSGELRATSTSSASVTSSKSSSFIATIQSLVSDDDPDCKPSFAYKSAVARCVFVVACTALVCMYPVFEHNTAGAAECNARLERLDMERDIHLEGITFDASVAFACVGLWLAAYFVCTAEMQWWHRSDRLAHVRWYIFAGWLLIALYVGTEMYIWCSMPDRAFDGATNLYNVKWPPTPTRVLTLLIEVSTFLFIPWHFQLMGEYLDRLEIAFDKALGSRTIKVLVYINYIGTIVLTAFSCVCNPRKNDELMAGATVANTFMWMVWSLLALCSGRGFLLSYCLARRELEHCALRCERKAAERIAGRAKRVLLEAPISLTAMCVIFILWSRMGYDLYMPHERYICACVPLCFAMTTRFVMILAGIDPPGLVEMTGTFIRRCVVCVRTMRAMRNAKSSGVWSTGDAAWDEKVMELSMRGISLQALLEFYWSLGSGTVMPHYEPAVHTTADVVRQAIIPTTADTTFGACALATVLMDGRRVRPMKLVTHSWSNRFCHLVAAIVADALELPTYEEVVWRLTTPSQRRALWAELLLRAKMGLTYWVCAFSVCQHTCICDNLMGGPSDATGHAICGCSTKKHLNHSEPTRADGQSINCEVNKFDDMMAFLASVDPRSSQCIAVDEHLDIFNRAWCIAEIHRAHKSQMQQCLRLFSSRTLSEHKSRLKNLRVEKMEASNPADKRMILERIGDIHGFNKSIQGLLFCNVTGLLSTWGVSGDLPAALKFMARRAKERKLAAEGSVETAQQSEPSSVGSPQQVAQSRMDV
eukprot:TRINITY_DN27285_c0_g2_i2.p1 TRINITY_DN27285_c0_g2~~TRINITY_DN27285_c0_g2_i2.p1  ORF type:complete len:784 (+),score=115.85 TRINITY_DN27285_c0_g2_i2:152-2503(+)